MYAWSTNRTPVTLDVVILAFDTIRMIWNTMIDTLIWVGGTMKLELQLHRNDLFHCLTHIADTGSDKCTLLRRSALICFYYVWMCSSSTGNGRAFKSHYTCWTSKVQRSESNVGSFKAHSWNLLSTRGLPLVLFCAWSLKSSRMWNKCYSINTGSVSQCIQEHST